LLAVEPMARREREQLRQRRRLTPLPRLARNLARSDSDMESAEQLDPDVCHAFLSSVTLRLPPPPRRLETCLRTHQRKFSRPYLIGSRFPEPA
jgi:hypothetical protein